MTSRGQFVGVCAFCGSEMIQASLFRKELLSNEEAIIIPLIHNVVVPVVSLFSLLHHISNVCSM